MSQGKEKQPPGGFDSTPLRPTSGPTYTVKFTFHRAVNIPVSDYASRSSDPYVTAQVNTGLPTRHPQDPPVRFRSQTVHKSLKPEWNSVWVVAGLPERGFELSVHVWDEDPDDHDDRLGKFKVETGRLSENWKGYKEEEFKIRKTGANVRAYTLRWARKIFCRDVDLHGYLIMSMEVIGKTEEEVGKAYTVNNFWWQHYSPLIGRVAGVKTKGVDGVERFDFQANQIQLRGPVPNELYHRYVDFRGFVGGMFKGTGIRGRILHKALHHQHERIYNFNTKTQYGTFPDGPGKDMTLKFLEMVHFDEGGRIFTYVITLDGLFRFTETGKEFGIDLLSKHTMHSDVHIYIAWSGEFLVRRLAHPHEKASAPDQHTHPSEDIPGGPPNSSPPRDPAAYELIIDNDSGTYRPNADLIPIFQKFLEKNFPGLHIIVKSCTDKDLDKIKEDQKKTKKTEGDGRIYGQGSRSGSISSSDVSSLDSRAREQADQPHKSGLEKGLDALERPDEAFRGMIGQKGKLDRENREEAEDQATSGPEASGTANGDAH